MIILDLNFIFYYSNITSTYPRNCPLKERKKRGGCSSSVKKRSFKGISLLLKNKSNFFGFDRILMKEGRSSLDF